MFHQKSIEKWQLLKNHLENVAIIVANFVKFFNGKKWAYLSGLWHNLGKYYKEWQKYIHDLLPNGPRHASVCAQYSNIVYINMYRQDA